MSGQDLITQLKERFGDQIQGANLEAIDPWIEIAPEGLLEVCRFLHDDPELRFDFLSCISGVDYFEPDPKKAAKLNWEPHLEVVYHLWSVTNKKSLVLKVGKMLWGMNFQRFLRWWRSGVRRTGTNARFMISRVFISVVTPICDGFSARKIGSGIPSGKIMKCHSNTMESAVAETKSFGRPTHLTSNHQRTP